MTTFTTLKKLIAWRPGPKPVAQIDDEEEESDGMKILKQIIAEHKANPRAAFVPLSERPTATMPKLPSKDDGIEVKGYALDQVNAGATVPVGSGKKHYIVI